MLNVPSGHSEVDYFLRNPVAHPLPTGHVKLESLVSRRSFWSPGIVFSCLMLSIFCVAWLSRLCQHPQDSVMQSTTYLSDYVSSQIRCVHKETHVSSNSPGSCPSLQKKATVSTTVDEKPFSCCLQCVLPSKRYVGSEYHSGDANVASLENGIDTVIGETDRQHLGHFERKSNVEGILTDIPPPRSLVIHQSSLLHAQHVADTGYEVEETRASTIAMPDVFEMYSSSFYDRIWNLLTGTRIPWTNWSTGNVIFCLLYVVVNFVALIHGVYYSGYSVERGLGSLAAANTAFLIVPATRSRAMARHPLSNRGAMRSLISTNLKNRLSYSYFC